MKPIISFLLLWCFVSCSKDEPPKPAPVRAPTAPEAQPQPEPPPAVMPSLPLRPETPLLPEPEPATALSASASTEVSAGLLAIIKSGANPLWFELDSGQGVVGPSRITNPDRAALTAFIPWTLARFAAGMVMYENRLVIGINRAGFLMLTPRKDGSLSLYRSTDPYWENYTIGSMFRFEEHPAVLLYRDGFFVDPVAQPPSPKVFAQIGGSPQPVGVRVQAFDAFPSSAGWDLDALRQGPDGYWYYRGVLRSSGEGQPKTVYFRTPGLALSGEPVSLGDFRNSALPVPSKSAPPLLQAVLERAFRLADSNLVPIAGIISPDFPYIRYFSPEPSLAGSGRQLLELSGYYLQTGSTAQAAVILPNGRGIAGKTRAGTERIEAITLPPLPEGFVYTRIGLSGETLIGAWEEQQDMSIGAAGLMLIQSP